MFAREVIMPVRMRSPVHLKCHRFQTAISVQNSYKEKSFIKTIHAETPENACKDTPAIKLHGHTVFTDAHMALVSKYTPSKPVSTHLIFSL